MRRAGRFLVFIATMALLWSPGAAHAEGFAIPWAGVHFGEQPVKKAGAFGITAGTMGAGVLGMELDLGYSPDVFEEPADTYALTAMGNLIIGIPLGGTRGPGVRPYVTGGLGLIRTKVGELFEGEETADNRFGLNAGGGVMVFLGDRVGLRGDLRYFRDLQGGDSLFDLEFPEAGDLKFWRASIGLVIR
jgi:opacity protein-like surface antigen